MADTSADRFILALTPVTNETAITDSYSLSGVVTDAYISVHPGQEYRLQLTASNVDGETKSNLNSFTTDPDCKLLMVIIYGFSASLYQHED